MTSASQTFRACIDLARAGNFPSVASNVLAALVLSSTVASAAPPSRLLVFAIVAGCLVYAGGATFNDVFDADFDRSHRAERAIPRGVISRTGAATLATIEMLLGVAVLVRTGTSVPWTMGLVVVILLYDWLHKRWIGAVVLMAGCRVLLGMTLASLPDHATTSAFLIWATALFVYIVTLSLIARGEYKPGAPVARIARSVGRLLAFIPLIDAAALLCVGAWIPAIACVAAIPLGALAQRLAAST